MGTLVARNVRVGELRTSMRMAPYMWEALDEICKREEITRSDFVTRVDAYRSDEGSLTDAVRVAILAYFRKLALSAEVFSSGPNESLVRSVMEMRP